jgi:hypothetical protein
MSAFGSKADINERGFVGTEEGATDVAQFGSSGGLTKMTKKFARDDKSWHRLRACFP